MAGSEAGLLQQALAFHRDGKLGGAQRRYEDVLKINPRNYDAWRLLGVVEFQRGNPRAARRTLLRAIALAPQVADAHYFLGRCLAETGEFGEAAAAYEACLQCDARHDNAAISLGIMLGMLGRPAEALVRLDAVIAASPNQRDALFGRAAILRKLQRHDDALADLDRVVALDPGHLPALVGRGEISMFAGNNSQARADFERCLQIDPDLFDAQAHLAELRLHLADWRDDGLGGKLLGALRGARKGLALSTLLSLEASPQDQLLSARNYVAHTVAVKPARRDGPPRRHDRIRVAYLSSDFRNHAVGFIAAGLLERHDAARFDIAAVALDPGNDSDVRRRIEAAVPRFLDAHALSDDEIAARLRQWDIDIAVDLNGHTLGARTGILANRAAPIQVNYLGYPGSMGADFMDYIVGDRTVIPDDQRKHFAEKVVVMPHCYLVADNHAIPQATPSRAEHGLPETGFVFCAFTGSYKITPAMFAVWMDLLADVDGSVMWFSGMNDEARSNFLRHAGARGLGENRLVFASRVPGRAEHLARHRLADLFLDTTPYNAHSTAADALWTGLPVLTCRGGTFAGRVAASALAAAGLPELVTSSLDDYRALALKLVREPAWLASLRERLRRGRGNAPLFDTARHVRGLETAYAAMDERHRAGLPPDHIVVADS